MSSLSIRNIRKVYTNGAEVLKNIELKIDDGEFLILVGPSGCGKSTRLFGMRSGIIMISWQFAAKYWSYQRR